VLLEASKKIFSEFEWLLSAW